MKNKYSDDLLYLKQINNETVDNTLERIIKYLDTVMQRSHKCPKEISLSPRDYQRILECENHVVHSNRIMGMEIQIREEER